MAFDGAGAFSRIYSWATDKANGIKIRADRMDTEMDGFATGLSTCILKDGTQTVTANIPFANFRLTGVGAGTALTDAANVSQVQNRTSGYAATSGTDTYTASFTPTITAYATGQLLALNFGNANTGAATINVDGLGAKSLTKNGTSDLVSGDVNASEIRMAVYDGTRFQLIGPHGLNEDQAILAAQIFS